MQCQAQAPEPQAKPCRSSPHMVLTVRHSTPPHGSRRLQYSTVHAAGTVVRSSVITHQH